MSRLTAGRALLTAAALCALSLPPAAAAPKAPRECKPDEAAVNFVLERLIASDNQRDLAGALAAYTSDVVWIPPSGEEVKGKKAVEAHYVTLFGTSSLDVTLEIEETHLSGTLAFARGRTRGTLKPLKGGSPTAIDDRFLAVFHCDEGQWRIARLMWNPAAAPPAH